MIYQKYCALLDKQGSIHFEKSRIRLGSFNIGMGIFSLYNKRERGLKHTAGYENQIHKSIYSHLESYSYWNSNSENGSEYGGVYNLEYSPDG